MNGLVHPPRRKLPSVSSPACPGPWITPSSEVYSITTILLIVLPPCVVKLIPSRQRTDVGQAGLVRPGPHVIRPGRGQASHAPHWCHRAMIFLTAQPGGSL